MRQILRVSEKLTHTAALSWTRLWPGLFVSATATCNRHVPDMGSLQYIEFRGTVFKFLSGPQLTRTPPKHSKRSAEEGQATDTDRFVMLLIKCTNAVSNETVVHWFIRCAGRVSVV